MNPLDNLNDIAEPVGVAFWPLAWGWWLVFALGVVFVLCLVVSAIRYRRKHAARRATRKLLQQQFEQKTLSLFSANTLLKRVCMSYTTRDAVAALHGEKWVNTLQESVAKKAKTHPYTKRLSVFKQAQYLPEQQSENAISQHDLYNITLHWLNKLNVDHLTKLHKSKGEHV